MLAYRPYQVSSAAVKRQTLEQLNSGDVAVYFNPGSGMLTCIFHKYICYVNVVESK